MDKLCIAICRNYARELRLVSAEEEFQGIVAVAFPANCGNPPHTWQNWGQVARKCEVCSHVEVLGPCYLTKLGDPPSELARFHFNKLDQCFYMFAGRTIIDSFIQQKAYLVTPGWLSNWQNEIIQMGFDSISAPEFFADFAEKIVLLDTGVNKHSAKQLGEFSSYVQLPSEVFPVGLDHFRLFLTKLVAKWRLATEKESLTAIFNNTNRRIADYAMAFDLLNNLVTTVKETDVIQNIVNLFSMLFAPGELYYIPVTDGKSGELVGCFSLPPGGCAAVQERLLGMTKEYETTDTGDGFRIRIRYGNETLGVLEANRLFFPEHREHYLNLALSVVWVCGLAIENARRYQKIMNAESALRASNQQLEIQKGELENKALERTLKLQQQMKELEKSRRALLGILEDARQTEMELSKQEKLLRTIAENFPHSYLSIIEKDLTVGFTSGQEFVKLGLEPDSFIGRSLEDIFGEHSEVIKQHYLDTFAGKENSFELFINHQYQLYKTVPLVDESGEIQRILAVVENITERKLAEKEASLEQRRLASLYKISQDQTASYRTLLNTALDEALALSGSKLGFIYIYNEGIQEFTLHAWSRNVLEACAIPDLEMVFDLDLVGLLAEAVRQRQPILINDFLAPNPLKKGFPDGHAELFRFLSIPIFDENKIAAMLGLANKETDYTNVEVRQLTLMMEAILGIAEHRRVAEALDESEARYMDLYDNAPDMYGSVDAKTALIQRCNQTLANNLGYSKEDIVGQPIFEIYHPDCMEEVKKTFKQFTETGEVHDKELQLMRKDGSKLDVSLNVSAVSDEKGNILFSRSTWRDITERKRNEAINSSRLYLLQFAVTHSLDELLEETLNQTEILTGSLIGFYHFVEEDQKSLTLQNWSTRTKAEFCKAEGQGLHYSTDEAGVWVDCIHQRKPVIHNDYVALHHRKGMPEGHAEVVRQLVVPVLRGENITAILGVGNKPTEYNEQDISAVALLADLAWEIAERKRVEENIQQRSRELAILYDASRILSQSLDPEVIGQRLIETMEKFLGYEHGAVLVVDDQTQKISILSLSTQGGGEEFLAQKRQYINGKMASTNRGIVRWVITHGQAIRLGDVRQDPRYLSIRENIHSELCVPLMVGEKIIGALNVESAQPDAYTENDERLLTSLAGPAAVAIENARLYDEVQDYSSTLEQRVAERTDELEAINKELEAFSYSVSHDLRAPLRAMDGFSLAVLEDYGYKLDEEGKDYLQRIRGASQHMGQLIDDILQLSRVSRAEMHTESVDLSEIIQSIADALKQSQPERRVMFSIQKDIKVQGDKRLLTIAMENLLGNAWKFTANNPKAQIEFGSAEQEGDTAFFVRDNGVGFDMKRAKKLFTPFQRLHSEKDFPGTGIGLSTVQRIIRRHGGEIWAEAETGKSATFYFSF